jgi:hypothetical protein
MRRYKINSHFIASLLITGVMGGLAYGSSPLKGEEEEHSPSQLVRAFSSVKEMLDYAKAFEDLANAKRYEDVIKADSLAPSLHKLSPLSLSDLERYNFSRAWALYATFNFFAEQNTLRPEIQRDYLDQSIEVLSQYYHYFTAHVSQIPLIRERMIHNRFLIGNLLSEVYFKRAAQEMEIFDQGAAMPYFWKMTTLIMQTIKVGEQHHDMLDEKPEELVKQLSALKLRLISVYTSLATYLPPDVAVQLREKIRILERELRQGKDEERCQNMALLRQVREKQQEKEQVGNQTPGSREVEKRRAARIDRLNKELTNLAEELRGVKSKVAPLKIILQEKYRKINFIPLNKDNAPEIMQIIIATEDMVIQELEKQNNELRQLFPLREVLAPVYQNMAELLGLEALIRKTPTLLCAFVLNKDLEGAIVRGQILTDLELQKQGTVSLVNRVFVAGIKNLRGDHEDWLALEQECTEKLNAKKARKKERRKQARLRHVEQIKMAVQAERVATDPSVLPTQPAVSMPKALAVIKRPQAEGLHEFLAPYVPAAQLKQEKQKRHQASLKRKEEKLKEKENEEEEITTVAPQPAAPGSFEDALKVEDYSLREVYHLKGLALRVDKAIEDGTWAVTRAEMQAYFEAMGCVYKPGKGSHSKISLPQSLHVMHQGTLITIFNELGGVLTLPQWEKHVPYYLRDQILIARQKLLSSSLKARHSLPS